MLDFDILAVGENGIKIPVEVKFTSRDRVSIAMLRDSGAKTARWKAHAVSARPLLVYGAIIERSMREWAESEFDIDIWDRDILLTKSKRTSAALEQFFQGTSDGNLIQRTPRVKMQKSMWRAPKSPKRTSEHGVKNL
ncbi:MULTISPECIES: hypothetical protein [Rhizobium]|nr:MULTISPECIES: hypothetical protein [Rhizobium]MBY5806456.1 hypothetical protein [Rhizobium leguminosarum]